MFWGVYAFENARCYFASTMLIIVIVSVFFLYCYLYSVHSDFFSLFLFLTDFSCLQIAQHVG